MKLLMEGWRKFLKEDMKVDQIEEALIADALDIKGNQGHDHRNSRSHAR